MKDFINTKKAPKPMGPYSQAVKAGKFLFVSGQVAIDPRDGKIVDGTVAEQTVQIMENISNTARSSLHPKRRYHFLRLPIVYGTVSRIQQYLRKILRAKISCTCHGWDRTCAKSAGRNISHSIQGARAASSSSLSLKTLRTRQIIIVSHSRYSLGA